MIQVVTEEEIHKSLNEAPSINGTTRPMTENERKDLMSDPRNKQAMSTLVSAVMSSKTDYENKLKVLKTQNIYISAFVCTKLNIIDRWIFKRVFTIAQNKITSWIFFNYFKKKVIFLPFRDKEEFGFTINRPLLSIIDKVRIYSKEYQMEVPEYQMALDALVKRENDRASAKKDYLKSNPFRGTLTFEEWESGDRLK